MGEGVIRDEVRIHLPHFLVFSTLSCKKVNSQTAPVSPASSGTD